MRKIQVMGLSILAIILLSLTPASAFNSQEKTFQDVFRSKILESQQINDLENITDPVVRHFVEKKNNISLIMVYKFMQQISNEQSLLPKNESLYDFYADYLNGSNKTYILCESEFTAREAVKNIPV
ncbi:MAG: hypothetical protein LBR15_01415, partial [Methanobrevibacter sp.]|nr:hypothetical protein [Candidatus Methanovirga australis]